MTSITPMPFMTSRTVLFATRSLFLSATAPALVLALFALSAPTLAPVCTWAGAVLFPM